MASSAVAYRLPETRLQSSLSSHEETYLPLPPFDPAIHLNFEPPTARHSYTQLGFTVPKGCPDICYTEPFQLFSAEGIRMIRREVFQKPFLDKYIRSWDRASCAISGFSHKDNVNRTARGNVRNGGSFLMGGKVYEAGVQPPRHKGRNQRCFRG